MLANIRVGWKWMTVTYTLAYCKTKLITVEKSFIVHGQSQLNQNHVKWYFLTWPKIKGENWTRLGENCDFWNTSFIHLIFILNYFAYFNFPRHKITKPSISYLLYNFNDCFCILLVMLGLVYFNRSVRFENRKVPF